MTPVRGQPPVSLTKPDPLAPPGPRGAALRVAMILIAIFLSAAIFLWLLGVMPTRVAGDQNDYHLVAIRQFARTLPDVSLRDYPSATTPGYHLLLAGVQRTTGAPTIALQACAALFTVGLLGTFGWLLARRARAGGEFTTLGLVAVGAPLACSPYVLSSGVWLLPDNAAWWGVVAMLALGLCPPGSLSERPRSWLIAVAGVLLGLVLVRQNHVWTGAIAFVAAWLGRPRAQDEILSHPPLSPRDARMLVTDAQARAGRAGWALIACLPAAGALAYFVWLWKGLTPPSFQHVLHGGNAATPAFVLALFGVLGVFYLPGMWTPLRQVMSGRPVLALGGLSLALLAATLPITTGTTPPDTRRYGALWNIVGALPVVGERTSLLIVFLALVGMLVVLTILVGLPRRDRWVWLTALLGFTAAQTASAMCWQRYIEPLVLMLLAVAAATIHARYHPLGKAEARARVWGPLLLAAGLGGVMAWTVWRDVAGGR